jgi:hypothetical protein
MTTETIANEPDSQPASASTNRGERFAKIGTILSAIIASSCCWLPPILIGLGLLFGFSADRMIGALKGSMETYRPIFMVVTFGFLGLAFYFTYRPRRMAKGCAENC